MPGGFYDDLLKMNKYNKMIHPLANVTEKILVELGIRLSQITDVVRILILTVIVVRNAVIGFEEVGISHNQHHVMGNVVIRSTRLTYALSMSCSLQLY